jgi:hypothetical protein
MKDDGITYSDYANMADEIMFWLIKRGEEFTADDFYDQARNENMPPDLIRKFSGSYFKKYQAAGYIQQTDRFELSKRNGSSPLPVWIKKEWK